METGQLAPTPTGSAATAGPAWTFAELSHAKWEITQRRAVAMAWKLGLTGKARQLSISDPMTLFDDHVAKCATKGQLVTPKQWKVSVPLELLLKPGKGKTTDVTLWWNAIGQRWVDQSPAKKRKRADETKAKQMRTEAEEKAVAAKRERVKNAEEKAAAAESTNGWSRMELRVPSNS